VSIRAADVAENIQHKHWLADIQPKSCDIQPTVKDGAGEGVVTEQVILTAQALEKVSGEWTLERAEIEGKE
jgi:hypothetical protein